MMLLCGISFDHSNVTVVLCNSLNTFELTLTFCPFQCFIMMLLCGISSDHSNVAVVD